MGANIQKVPARPNASARRNYYHSAVICPTSPYARDIVVPRTCAVAAPDRRADRDGHVHQTGIDARGYEHFAKLHKLDARAAT